MLIQSCTCLSIRQMFPASGGRKAPLPPQAFTVRYPILYTAPTMLAWTKGFWPFRSNPSVTSPERQSTPSSSLHAFCEPIPSQLGLSSSLCSIRNETEDSSALYIPSLEDDEPEINCSPLGPACASVPSCTDDTSVAFSNQDFPVPSPSHYTMVPSDAELGENCRTDAAEATPSETQWYTFEDLLNHF